MYIVQGQKARAQHLVGGEQVPQIGAGESGAGRAGAGSVQRPGVVAEIGAADVDAARTGEGGAVAAHSRRGDAVEQVHAALDARQQVAREIPRP